jgi:arabinogalactan oligomer/maltooligosaccharide transport system substrate-binding protein
MRRALLIAALAAAGCARAPDPDAARTIVFWEEEDASVAPFLDSVAEGFRRLPGNEGVRFARTHYHLEEQRQQFQTASIAGSPPDLLLSPSDPAGIYSISGFILPVDDLFDLSRFNKPAVEAVTLEGKAWGVPMSNGNHLMLFYNKSLSPEPPRSTAEIEAFCDGRARELGLPFCWAFFMAEPFWAMPWLGAYGGWPIEGRSPTLDTPAMRDALVFLLDQKTRGRVPRECDYNCADTLFKERKVAFIVNGDWAIPAYRKLLGADFGAARIPRLSATGRWPTPMVSGKYFMLSSSLRGSKLDLVRRFVEYAVSPEVQTAQVKALGCLPSLASAARSEAVLGDPVLKASMDQLLVGRPMPAATEMRAVWDAIRPLYARVLSGGMSPSEAPAKMQGEALSKIAEMRE